MFLDIRTEFEDLQNKLSIADNALSDIQQTHIDEQTLENVVDTYIGMIRRDLQEMTPEEATPDNGGIDSE